VIYQNELGSTICRKATEVERQQIVERGGGETTLIYPGAPLRSQMPYGATNWSLDEASGLVLQPSVGLRIVLHGTAQLNQNPTAKNAFIAAANHWESIISTPITVVIDVDFGTTFFGTPYPDPSILGATGLDTFQGPFSELRQKLINGASNSAEQQLYNALPLSSVPVDFNGALSDATTASLALPNARALGLAPDITNPDSLPIGQGDAGIGFNSAFQFDFTPGDGITTGQTDFDAVATHEIGHALGFISEAGGSSASPVSVWDLFRFRPATATLANFATVRRIMSIGGSQIFFSNRLSTFATTELGLSTGGPDPGFNDGDGRQSSHWQDDSLFTTRPYIGIMDPTLARGVRKTISENDITALDLFGYSIGLPAPVRPPNDNFANAIALQTNSGSLTGSSVNATREPGEPNHAAFMGDKSVWYSWVSPLNGQITIDTIGSNYDTTLGVYTGSAVNQLVSVAQNDDIVSGTNRNSRVEFNVTAGTTYRIAIDGWNGEYGSVSINWNAGLATPTPTPTPTPTRVLTISSVNPGSGVPVTLTPNDNAGLGNGSTELTRTYNQFATVNVSVPISVAGNYFQKWQLDGSDLTTSRATSVNLSINRTLTAVYITLPSTPTPTPTPTPTGPGQAVAYQINPAHTGSQFDNVSPPLGKRWTRDLGGLVSYPLIAGGKVYVTNFLGLHALDATTGATVWGPIALGGNHNTAAAAYEDGRVFAFNGSGLLRGFDATTGAELWSRQLSGQEFLGPPTALGGTVYVNGYPTLFAVSAQDGSIKWSAPNAGGLHSSPTVSPTGVYVSYACGRALALSPATGAILWQHTPSCFGIVGKTTVLFGGRVYVRGGSLEDEALDMGAGIQVAGFAAGPAPAFNGSTGYFLNGTTLEARDISSGTLRWSFAGDGTLSTAPIVVNGIVYIGSNSGNLYALSEGTGANVWIGTVGAAVTPPDEGNASQPLTGLGAGEGLVVVPALNLLVAYQPIAQPAQSVQLSAATYTAGEGTPGVNITISRSGDTSSSASVSYTTTDNAGSQNCATKNGNASQRCDYINTVGTVNFNPLETSKSVSVAIVDDAYAEGPETFSLTLNNAVGAGLGAQSAATVTITDNDSVDGANPVDVSSFFVRQHYIDFLNREPDSSGLNFWTAQIESCTPKPQCTEIRRINVSAAFFLSIEFQETGYLVYRFYKSAYGNIPGTPVPVRLNEFLPDTQQIGRNVVIGQPGADLVLEANKILYSLVFVTRSRFITAYPFSLTPTQFVDALFTNAGVTPSAADRNAAIGEFSGAGNTIDLVARARALRRVAENSILNQQEKNRAFVLMQYFGYLRRNPNDPPELNLDFGGYNFWLGKLNQFNGNFVDAEMVKAFIVSGEYRQRFGP
jgi:outer membrane protein assembly factor BamB